MAASSTSEATRMSLQNHLANLGNNLLKPSGTTEVLLTRLDKLESQLSRFKEGLMHLVELKAGLEPSMKALTSNQLLKHAEMDVRVSVACCMSHIIRMTTPDEPFDEPQMKEFFQLANEAYGHLPSMTGRAYLKALSLLKSVSHCHSCLIMIDLDLYDLICDMFRLFLKGVRTSHPEATISNMEKIMTLVIRNCEDCGEFIVDLLMVLLPSLKKKNHDVSPSAFNLAKKVFEKCADDLKTYLPQAVTCLGNPVEKYDGVVASFCPDLAQWENMVARDIGGHSRHTEFSQSLYDGLFKLWEDDETTVDLRNDENKNTGANKETLVSESRGISLKQMTQPLKVYKRQRKEESTSKQKDAEDIGINVGPPIHDAYQDNKAVDLKNKYVNEDLVTGKHHGEYETIGSHQLKLKSKEAGSMRKRTWKPNFLRKPEEGYEHLWTSSKSTSSSGSNLRKERRKKVGRSLNSIISKLDSQSLSEPAGEQPDLQETISIKKNTENSLVPSASIPVTNKSRIKSTASNNVKASKDGGRCNGTELVGSKIKVWWPVDEMFYEGKVTSFDHLRKLHQVDYDDGVSVTLDLTKERWQLLNDDNLSGHEHQTI